MFNESIKFSMTLIWLFFRQGQGIGPNLSLQIRQIQPSRFVGAAHTPNAIPKPSIVDPSTANLNRLSKGNLQQCILFAAVHCVGAEFWT